MRFRVWAFALLLVSGHAAALETSLAEFLVTSDTDAAGIDAVKFNQQLLSAVASLDSKGSVGFRYRPSAETGGLVRSAADAVRICEVNGWETLIYGQLVQRAESIEAEIRIYSHPDRKLVHTYLLRSSKEDYDTLVADCAQKIYGYFAQLLYLSKPVATYTAEKNSWITGHSLLWWGALPKWSGVLTTIAAYQGTWGVRFGDPLWTNGEWSWLGELGLSSEFLFALNARDVVPSRLYDVAFGPKITSDWVWQRRQELSVSVIPAARFHILNYVPLFGSSTWTTGMWYGGEVETGARFWVDEQRTFGIGVTLGGSVYAVKPLYADYQVGVSLTWKGGL